MGIEFELKYRATPEIQEKLAETGCWHSISMETTYYDTPSASLSARHYTLRRRLENEKSVCTLKTPAGKARCEWELTCDTIEEAIKKLPGLGCPENFAELVQEGIVPVCGAKFTRIAKTLVFPEGTLELALDQGILMGGGKEIPLCEIEVELKSGAGAFCDLFAKALAARFGLTQQKASKFKRALALYKGE
jgi:inorganic triphosphatase YgiF